MSTSDERALKDLYALSCREDLQKTLDAVFYGYLESNAADEREERTSALILYQRLSNLF